VVCHRFTLATAGTEQQVAPGKITVRDGLPDNMIGKLLRRMRRDETAAEHFPT
jgi:hypothetical protein